MTSNSNATRVAGAWLPIASVLLAIVFVFHGPLEARVGDEMSFIAGESTRWLTALPEWLCAWP